MGKHEPKGHTGNRGVGGEVHMSFMCSKAMREQIHATAAFNGIGASQFIREAIEESLIGFEKGSK